MKPLLLAPPPRTRRRLGVPKAEGVLQRAVVDLTEQLVTTPGEGQRLIVAEEVRLPFGRPDVMAAVVDVHLWHRRRKLGIRPCTAPLPLRVAQLLAQLGGRANVSEILHAVGTNELARARDSLRLLTGLGWIRRQGESAILRAVPGEAVSRITAIETKLNNWPRAVRQAQSWEGRVDTVWLAFPTSYMTRFPRTRELRRFGLISVSDGTAKIVRRPLSSRVRGPRRALTEEYLFERWAAHYMQSAR